jgi:hypothetical protein
MSQAEGAQESAADLVRTWRFDTSRKSDGECRYKNGNATANACAGKFVEFL